jgi:single-strand DNA-binding protein
LLRIPFEKVCCKIKLFGDTQKMSFNKIIIVGNLGRDPELRYTPQGSAVCSFSVATTEKRRDKSGEMSDITTWFKVTLWEKRAETASKYLTKGSQVYIEGKLRTEEWTDKDGKTRTSLEVQATDMNFIGTKSGGSGGSGISANTGGDDSTFDNTPLTTGNAPAGDDDIPF